MASEGPLWDAVEVVSDYCRHVALATVAAMGIGAVALFIVVFILDFTPFRQDVTTYQRLLVQRPFPIQVFVAAGLGWFCARHLARPQWSVWAWALPTVLLMVRLLTWKSSSVVSVETRLGHFFGPCPRLFCADQFFVVLPLYAAIAYSVMAAIRFRQAVPLRPLP
jgi:hypothetical protein